MDLRALIEPINGFIRFLLREKMVHRLSGEAGQVEPLRCGLLAFLAAAQAEPIKYLGLAPLFAFQDAKAAYQYGLRRVLARGTGHFLRGRVY